MSCLVIIPFVWCPLDNLFEAVAESLIPSVRAPSPGPGRALGESQAHCSVVARSYNKHKHHSIGEETEAQSRKGTCPRPRRSVHIFTLLQECKPRDHASPPAVVSTCNRPWKESKTHESGEHKDLDQGLSRHEQSKEGQLLHGSQSPQMWKLKDQG